jgi:hypothetical protein
VEEQQVLSCEDQRSSLAIVLVDDPYSARVIMAELTLRSVLDLKGLRHVLARLGRITTRRLKAVHSINATDRQALGVLEEQPLNAPLALEARACRRRGGGVVELADLGHGIRGGEVVEDEGGRVSAVDGPELVGADAVAVALTLEGPFERFGVGAQGECEGRDGGDLVLGHGVAGERGTDVVECRCALLELMCLKR